MWLESGDQVRARTLLTMPFFAGVAGIFVLSNAHLDSFKGVAFGVLGAVLILAGIFGVRYVLRGL